MVAFVAGGKGFDDFGLHGRRHNPSLCGDDWDVNGGGYIGKCQPNI